MSRRTARAAEEAAAAASEAARVLQSRGQVVKAERQEPPQVEPKVEKTERAEPKKADEEKDELSSQRINELKSANPRDRILEELAEADLKRRGHKEDPEEPKEEKKDEPKVEDPAPSSGAASGEETIAESAAEAAVEVQAEPKMVKQTVDGEDYEVSQAEIDEAGGAKAWRISKAQENRLKQVKESVAESKRLTAHLVELLQKRQEPEKPQATDEQFIAERMDRIRFGSQEEAAKAQIEILTRFNKPVDQGAIINQAVAAVDRRQAVADFGKEFPEIVATPMLTEFAVSLEAKEIAKAQKEGHQIDWRNLYRTIGTQIRGVVPPRQSQPATNPQKTASTPSQPSEKEARKASITNLPTASSARAELPKEEKPETRDDVLKEMRRSRGLPVG